MKQIAAVVFVVAMAFGPCTARADAITDWNQTAIEVMKTANVAGNPWSRALAMMHVAMSDAINSVQGRYGCDLRCHQAFGIGRGSCGRSGTPDFDWALSQPEIDHRDGVHEVD